MKSPKPSTKPKRVKATLYNGKTLQRFWADAVPGPFVQVGPALVS